jgi:hypothetical protein
MSVMWAIVCAGFTYDAVQEEKKSLYRSYMAAIESGRSETDVAVSPRLNNEELKALSRRVYRKELFELYWIFAPFLWLSLTFAGCIVAAGFLLPIRWSKGTPK